MLRDTEKPDAGATQPGAAMYDMRDRKGSTMQKEGSKAAVPQARWQFWIDRGGTFTDIVAKKPDGSLVTHKLLSENPEQYKDAAVAGIRHLLDLQPHERITADLVEAVKIERRRQRRQSLNRPVIRG